MSNHCGKSSIASGERVTPDKMARRYLKNQVYLEAPPEMIEATRETHFAYQRFLGIYFTTSVSGKGFYDDSGFLLLHHSDDYGKLVVRDVLTGFTFGVIVEERETAYYRMTSATHHMVMASGDDANAIIFGEKYKLGIKVDEE